MKERAERPAARVPSRGSALAARVGEDSVAERLLALQRNVGNAAVNRLLRIPAASSGSATAAPPASAPTRTLRARFEQQLHNRWAVADVGTGTEQQQIDWMRASTPTGQVSPANISGWQQWDPGPDDELYYDILDAFEALASAIGGIPPVERLRFHATDYQNVGGTATAQANVGAWYSGGTLEIFSRFATMSWPLPEGRSVRGAPAAVTYGSASDSRRRVLVHELSHGVFESFGSPMLGGNVQFFADWRAAAGWSSSQIVQNGTPLDGSNWNDDWPEEPVSRYSLTNPMEDFSESLMCFVEKPDVLRARSPGRFNFITARVAHQRASALRTPGLVTQPLERPRPKGDFEGPTGDERYA